MSEGKEDLASRIERIQLELVSLREQLQDKSTIRGEWKRKADKCKEQKSKVSEEIEKLRNARKKAEEDCNDLLGLKEEFKKKIDAARNHDEREGFRNEFNQILKKRKEERAARIADYEKMIPELRKNKNKLKKEYKALYEEYNKANKAKKSAERDMAKKEQELLQLVAELDASVEERKKEIREFTERKEKECQELSQQRALLLKTLLEVKSKVVEHNEAEQSSEIEPISGIDDSLDSCSISLSSSSPSGS